MENKVTLIGYYGGDERTCLSAWQSTNIELGIEPHPVIQERIAQLYHATVETKQKTTEELLKFLAQNHHISPFRKSHLDFQVTADIATHIHCIKHRVGVEVNGESARYKELKDKWYLPDDWCDIKVDIPPDDEPEYNYVHSIIEGEVGHSFAGWASWQEVLNNHCQKGHELYHEAIKQLTPTLGRARAKESARYFLPYAKQIDFDMQFSFEAFINFQKLRNSPHAQKEVRELAQQMLEQVRNIEMKPFMYSLKAFGL